MKLEDILNKDTFEELSQVEKDHFAEEIMPRLVELVAVGMDLRAAVGTHNLTQATREYDQALERFRGKS